MNKRNILLCVLLLIFMFVGCSFKQNENKLPTSKPNDFNFVFNYGIGAKNQINTLEGTYTKDMVVESSITTNLNLSDEEMNTIFSEMKRINILNYPDNFNPKSDMKTTPYNTFTIKIYFDKKEKSINWNDENASDSKEAEYLRAVFKKIISITENKEEYKKLPKAKGGYL